MSHTARQYTTFQDAYDHFNATLWDGKLPPCLITLQRKANSRGCFRGNGFVARSGDRVTDEIALNPDTFAERTDREILSTLAHEMAHLWQHHHGQPSRSHHNQQWAAEMERIGLMPTATGAPGGKRTGQRVTHYIIDGAAFDAAAAVFLAGRAAVDWASNGNGAKSKAAKASARSKTKFTCPECHQNAWAKPDANLDCGNVGKHASGQPEVMSPGPEVDLANLLRLLQR